MSLNEIDNKGLALTVFPFENLTGHNDYQIYCKAFWVDLITELSRFRHLQIIDYMSVSYILPNTGRDDESFFQRHTDYHIHGSFRLERGKITINTKLINSKTLQLVWADNFSGSDNEIFDLQESLLQKIVDALQHHINFNLHREARTYANKDELNMYN
jgi:adenylate cyclase